MHSCVLSASICIVLPKTCSNCISCLLLAAGLTLSSYGVFQGRATGENDGHADCGITRPSSKGCYAVLNVKAWGGDQWGIGLGPCNTNLHDILWIGVQKHVRERCKVSRQTEGNVSVWQIEVWRPLYDAVVQACLSQNLSLSDVKLFALLHARAKFFQRVQGDNRCAHGWVQRITSLNNILWVGV